MRQVRTWALVAIGLASIAAGPSTLPDPPQVVVDPALPAIADRVFELADFGATPDGKTMNTEAFGRAVAAIAKAHGGRLIVRAGTYRTLPFVLTSHMDLHLERSATILAADTFAELGLPDPAGATQAQLDATKKALAPLIGGKDLSDVAITGEGTINGSGDMWWAWSEKAARGKPGRVIYPRPRLIQIEHCARLHVHGLTLTRSPSFHFVPSDCQDVLIEDVKIESPADSPNTDGIDPSACRNVLIRRCTIDCGDDNIAFKGGRGIVEHVLVTDCTCKHGHGISVGSETMAGVRDVLVRHCTFENTHPAIRIKSSRGRGGITENITYSDITMKNVGTAITINLYYFDKKAAGTHEAAPVTATTPIVRNILIRDVTVSGAKLAGEIIGLPEMPVSNVVLERVTIEADKGMTMQDAKGIELRDVRITPKSGPPWVVKDAEVHESSGR